MKFKRDVIRPGYDFNCPTFILDENFHYVDWNYAFDELFAKEYNLRLGMHGSYIDQFLVNCEQVSERTAKVFSEGLNPLMDTEPVILKTERYGIVRAQKIAAQIIDEKGHKSAWVVSLSILSADRMPRLWEDLMVRFEKEVKWSSLISLRSEHYGKHVDVEMFRANVSKWVEQSGSTLIVGVPSPLVLPERGGHTIIEPNHQAWEMARSTTSCQVVKAPFEILQDLQPGQFQRILLSDTSLRVENIQLMTGLVGKLATLGTQLGILSSDLIRERETVAKGKLEYEETLLRFPALDAVALFNHLKNQGIEILSATQTFFSESLSFTRLGKK